MRIAVLGPCDLAPLASRFDTWDSLPPTYSFPYIGQLVSAYLSRGHEVEVVTSSEFVQSSRRWQGEGGLGVSVVPRRPRAKARASDLFGRESRWIAEATRRVQPDVVHAHWLYEFAAGGLAVHPDALITAHDAPISVVRYYGRHPYWWLRELVGIRTLRSTKHLTAVAPSLARELRPFLSRNLDITVIPNGLNIERKPAGSADRAIQQFTKPVFAVIANGFDSRKNTALALQAFGLVRRDLPGSTMHMYGRGHEVDGPAHLWAADHGLEGNVGFHGSVAHEELQSRMSGVDIVVHPSRWEACSLAVLEARAMGIPIIGSRNAGGMSYTLDDGLSGRLVRPRATAYAKAMLELAEDDQLYGSISHHAQAGLHPTFDMDSVTENYLELLRFITETRTT